MDYAVSGKTPRLRPQNTSRPAEIFPTPQRRRLPAENTLLSFGASTCSFPKACGFAFSPQLFNRLCEALNLEGDIKITNQQMEALKELREAITTALLKQDNFIESLREQAMVKASHGHCWEIIEGPWNEEACSMYPGPPIELFKLVYGLSQLYFESREGKEGYGSMELQTLICRIRDGDCGEDVLNDTLLHLHYHFETTAFADRIVEFCGLEKPKGQICKEFCLKNFSEEMKSSELFDHAKWECIDFFFKERIFGVFPPEYPPELIGFHWDYLKVAVYYSDIPPREWMMKLVQLATVMYKELELSKSWITRQPEVRLKGEKAFEAFGEDIEEYWN